MPTAPLVTESLMPLLEKYWRRFAEKSSLEDAQQALVNQSKAQIDRLWVASDFVAEQCIQNPLLLVELLGSGDLERRFCAQDYQDSLLAELANITSQEALGALLRRFRQREMVRLIWRDVLQVADLEELLRSLSDLADVCLTVARDCLHGWLEQKLGSPHSEDGVAQQLVVIAMGKLGARELNLSSDIDLIFAYPQRGHCTGVESPVSNQEFFVSLGQQLIQSLDQVTEAGFVFRVDMRLRPYGQSGALVSSFDALETYYQSQGREWERYAFVKARPMTPEQSVNNDLMARLQPFVYRRYVDYSAIESLRDMKALINREVRRRGVNENIKLGPGGIREVEFIVQAVQLINGGRDRRLQESNLLSVLGVLSDGEYYPQSTVAELEAAYRFLRILEHRIQGLRDKQTQTIPPDSLDRQRVAASMGYGCWDDLQAQLDVHRAEVRGHFDLLISKDSSAQSRSGTTCSNMALVWNRTQSDDRLVEILLAQGVSKADAQGLLKEIEALKNSKQLKRSQAVGVQRLDQLMPSLLEHVVAGESPLSTFERILPLLYQVLRRSAYLVLLLENEVALKHLVVLCEASPWIADQLANQPLLLDELIDAKNLFSHPDLAALKDELRQQLLRIPNEDLEQQMECLRHFKKGHVLRVAATESSAFRPLMKVSDYLSDIAEATLSVVADIAWQQMVDKYGYPTTSEGRVTDRPFLIIAYGKLAGYELSYSSDLDLVFVYECPSNLSTDGERSIDNTVFFTRLVQRVIHVLTSNTRVKVWGVIFYGT
ncbi:MAG: bifunctional [glutamate--ammonia ligase]-adenylyl-L-tyrosine phosphorylase/[glutamate--ammonia-ligase] adenylyltransferase [Gammaproteobacteria bacterium]|nr:MAG: bifunctional [glutamate--ammonia ligase]-adenylyl-L-tyrosine phosphorylase/[glutamate--ammonia-ligase] adenylyltransferase [Gammaproteobacteria bacterium]